MSENIEVWVTDAAHTRLEFTAKHMMITNVRGHFGEFEGKIYYDPTNWANSRVEGIVHAHSLNTGQPDRDAHLRSADFFHVEEHPQLDFRSTKITPGGGGEFKVTGDLTIRGVTKSVTFDVTDEGRGTNPWGGKRWGLTAETKVNRKDWGLNWNAALEAGGWLVGDTIKITAEIQLMPEVEYQTMQAQAKA